MKSNHFIFWPNSSVWNSVEKQLFPWVREKLSFQPNFQPNLSSRTPSTCFSIFRVPNLNFIFRVSQCSQVNQMHARNIATCLFPTFFPPDASNFSPATFNTDSCIFIDILVLLIGPGEYNYNLGGVFFDPKMSFWIKMDHFCCLKLPSLIHKRNSSSKNSHFWLTLHD